MRYIGKHFERETFYVQFDELNIDQLPISNWVCFAIANEEPNKNQLSEFIRTCIKKDLFEFKGFGIYGDYLHTTFDLEMTKMEVDEGHPEIEIMTTGNNDTDLSNAFWECYFATCLPEKTDYDNVKIICVNFDNTDYSMKLTEIIGRFNRKWLPMDEERIKYNQSKNIEITLTKNESLVLFEFLNRFNETDKKEIFEDQAEEKILWDLECILQKNLSEPFKKDYPEIIKNARNKVRDDIKSN